MHVTSSWAFAQTCHPFASELELAITVTTGMASVSLGQLCFSEVALPTITDSPDSVAFVAGDYLERLEEVL